MSFGIGLFYFYCQFELQKGHPLFSLFESLDTDVFLSGHSFQRQTYQFLLTGRLQVPVPSYTGYRRTIIQVCTLGLQYSSCMNQFTGT